MQISQEEIPILEDGIEKKLLVKKISANENGIKLYKYEIIK